MRMNWTESYNIIEVTAVGGYKCQANMGFA